MWIGCVEACETLDMLLLAGCDLLVIAGRDIYVGPVTDGAECYCDRVWTDGGSGLLFMVGGSGGRVWTSTLSLPLLMQLWVISVAAGCFFGRWCL
ncbi:hypothetical protein Nepgr_031768 [Nepenthes gracilis]|uniref:Uncharacterized protein n=1 Tax=Nepenthes gracilis TaxID=150966 RepID=A0AAD3Y751_NEPGR|nr:hypothetical protein Nepgr_031768 [Nepenthes gracilis]